VRMAQGRKCASAGSRAGILASSYQPTGDSRNKRGGADCRSRSSSSFHAGHVTVVERSTPLMYEPPSSIAIDSSRTPLPSRPGSRLPVVRVLLGLILVFGAYAKLHFNGAWH